MKWQITLAFLIGFVWGAVAHEKDLARNFNETGDAKGWTVTIKGTPHAD